MDNNRVYTVMEYIKGKSLKQYLEDVNKVSQQQTIKWADQLCDALLYLHSQTPKILHSDIKPANIMIRSSGDICLIDFNISLLMGDNEAIAVGRSYGYASPEHYGSQDDAKKICEFIKEEQKNDKTESFMKDKSLKNNTEYLNPNVISPKPQEIKENLALSSEYLIKLDVRSDIYSLGATLYHTLTGERPNAIPKEINHLSSFDLNLSEGTVYIIERAMNPKPEERFQNSSDMLRAIRNIHKLYNRWKKHILKNRITFSFLIILFMLSGFCIFLGIKFMANEKEHKYSSLLCEIELESDYVKIDRAFNLATEMFPHKIDAYYSKAVNLVSKGEYELCLSFINENMQQMHVYDMSEQSKVKLGDLYFIMGNCYFEQGDYNNSVVYYRSAVDLNNTNPEYYRDYAISLVRSGDINGAKTLLSKANDIALSNDSLNLLRGEISYADKNYVDAIGFLKHSIDITDDEYVLYRAYHICSDIYKKTEDYYS